MAQSPDGVSAAQITSALVLPVSVVPSNIFFGHWSTRVCYALSRDRRSANYHPGNAIVGQRDPSDIVPVSPEASAVPASKATLQNALKAI